MKDLITAMRVLAEEVRSQSVGKAVDAFIGEFETVEDGTLFRLSKALNTAADRLEAELPKDEWINNIGLNDICPVESNTKIDVRLREGQTMRGLTAGNCRWINAGAWNDIIDYRVIPQ